MFCLWPCLDACLILSLVLSCLVSDVALACLLCFVSCFLSCFSCLALSLVARCLSCPSSSLVFSLVSSALKPCVSIRFWRESRVADKRQCPYVLMMSLWNEVFFWPCLVLSVSYFVLLFALPWLLASRFLSRIDKTLGCMGQGCL
jgi:hypothetical protein